MAAIHGDDRLHSQPLGLHIYQQKGDALLFLNVRVCPGEAENHVRLVRLRGPDFLTVDNVFVAIEHSARLQRCQIRTRARLRIALAPQFITRQDIRQVTILLGLSTEGVNDRADHRNTEAADPRRVVGAVFFLEDMALRHRPADATIFYWPSWRDPSPPIQRLVPSDHVGFRNIRRRSPNDLTHRLRQVLFKEGADFLTE